MFSNEFYKTESHAIKHIGLNFKSMPLYVIINPLARAHYLAIHIAIELLKRFDVQPDEE